MNDYMTVGANRTQIFYRINYIGFADFIKGFQVMHMNDISTNFTICLFKIKTTNDTPYSIILYALVSSISISFIAIHIYLFFGTFIEIFVTIKIYFFWNCYF